MRVLLVHNRYRAPGGEERHVELLETGLSSAGIEVRRFERTSADIASSRRTRALAALTLAYRPGGGGIDRALAEWQPSVVHFHNIWPLLTPAALRAVRRTGAAVVFTAHNYRFACPAGTLLRSGTIHDDCIHGSSFLCGARNARGTIGESLAYGVALEIQRRSGMLRRWVDAFVAPSRFMATTLVRSGLPAERTHVIPHGLPLGEPPADGGVDHVLYVGRLASEKGVETLVRAAELRPEIPFRFAGSGPLASLLEAGPGNVQALGRLDRDGLAEALRNAALTVIPSEWHENLPFAGLESLGAGRPVIATNLGGLPEIVDHGETGFLIPPRNPRRLADTIGDLWMDRERATVMGANARRVAERRFSLDANIAQLSKLYRELLTRTWSRGA